MMIITVSIGGSDNNYIIVINSVSITSWIIITTAMT